MAHTPGQAITSLPAKQARISLPNPICATGENWTATYVITRHLVAELYGTAEFRLGNNALLMG